MANLSPSVPELQSSFRFKDDTSVRRQGITTHQKGSTTTAHRSPLRGLFLLTLLTISVTICWMPIDIYYTMSSMTTDLDMPVFFRTAEILFSLQTTIDPILFTLSMKNLRGAIKAHPVRLMQ